jgi:molecular chaperone DnaK (HSP70)
MKTILGIDFGTTTTTIGMTSENSRFEPELVEIDGITTVDSVLRLDPAGERVEQIGRDAWEEISLYPDRTFYAFKSKTGADYEYKFGSAGKVFTAKELGVLFLRVIREKIERQQFNGASLKDSDAACVIGYPAEWSGEQKSLIVQAAAEAGFPNVVGCEEPVGVVYYHHFKGDLSVNENQTILVYDFGGGTTDVAIVRTGKGELPEIIGFGGTDLGGHHFDEKLRQSFSAKTSMSLKMAELTPSDQALMKRYSRLIKEKLSVSRINGTDRAEITIPVLETSKAFYRMILKVEEFERECKNFIDRFYEPIHSALEKSGLEAHEIDITIVAGGSGRLYYVSDKINHIFSGKLNIRSTNPQEVIAKGLSVFASVKKLIDDVKQNESLNNIECSDGKDESALSGSDAEGKETDAAIITEVTSMFYNIGEKIKGIFRSKPSIADESATNANNSEYLKQRTEHLNNS